MAGGVDYDMVKSDMQTGALLIVLVFAVMLGAAFILGYLAGQVQ